MVTPPPTRPRRLARWARWVLGVLALWFVVHTAVVLWYGLADDTRPSDVGVVLGNYVAPDGTVGEVVKARLDRVVEMYKAGAFANVIVSGADYSAIQYNEVAGMRRYLVEQGIPNTAIIADHSGFNTFCTALDTREIMRQRGWHSVMIVTHYYHVLRTRLAFSRMGLLDVRSAHARMVPPWSEPYWLFREFVAFYRYALRRYPPEQKVPKSS